MMMIDERKKINVYCSIAHFPIMNDHALIIDNNNNSSHNNGEEKKEEEKKKKSTREKSNLINGFNP